jgi:mRNA interferase MazF
MPSYVPEKGDFITLSFDPQSGHEQKGRRPAIVISNFLFNKATGLAIVCPITNTNRNIPFHLPVRTWSRLLMPASGNFRR